MYKCKVCGKKFTELSGLYNHIESKHAEIIPIDMSVQQFYYYMKTGRSNGNCVMCKQPTTWNKNTNKYNRFCKNPKCKAEYVKIAKSRMIAKYGKVHLLNDPAKQREMLANRKISGVYRWSDSAIETTYTGSYELDFLKTLDGFFEWDPVDISMPSPHTYTYMYEGEQKFYIPDAYIHSLDCEIEIKDGGDNPNNHYKIQAVDKEKERLKDEVMTSQKAFHYVKITNKNYTNFFEFLKEVKEGFEKYGDEKKIPRIFKIEDIKTKNTLKPIKESYVLENSRKQNLYFISEDNMDNKTLYPRIPKNFLTKNGYEDDTTKRICFSTSIDKCLIALSQNLKGKEFYVHIPKPGSELDIEYPTIQQVPDCKITGEVWVKNNVKLKTVSKIKVVGDGENEFEYKYGNNKKATLYDWKWEYVEKIKEQCDQFIFEEGEEYIEEYIGLAQANKVSQIYSITKMIVKLIDSSLKRSEKYKEVKNKIKDILGDDRLNDLVKLDNIVSLAVKVITSVYTLQTIINILNSVKNLTPEELREMAELRKKVVKVVKEKDIDIRDSFEFNENEFDGLYESFVNDLVNELKSKTIVDNKFFIMQSYNVKKDSPEEIVKYLNKLIKAAKSEADIKFIKELVGKSDTYFHNMLRNKPEVQNQYNDFLKWTNSELPNTIKKKLKKINESSIIYESSLSMSRINLYLQKEYDKELKNYLDNYNTFYHRMLKERPDAVPNLNEDIRKAIIFIDGLAYKGVSNDLLQYARCELGDLVDLNKTTKEIKQSKYTQKITEDADVVSIVSTSIPSNAITLKIVYDNIDRPRQAFALNDNHSYIEINGKYIVQRDQVGTHCSIKPSVMGGYHDGKVVEMQIRYFEKVDFEAKIKEKMEKGIKINSLYNPNDFENRFVREVCLRLFDGYPETCTIIN